MFFAITLVDDDECAEHVEQVRTRALDDGKNVLTGFPVYLASSVAPSDGLWKNHVYLT